MSALGTIVPPGPLTVAAGATPAFVITPSQGLGIDTCTVDGIPVTVTDHHDGTYTYTFTPVHANHLLVVTIIANE
jgi:hypothetical protein